MDCNRDEAIRSMDIAEIKFKENNFAGAKKVALKAKALFESLEGIDQMIVALDVHLRAETRIGGEKDWYQILEVSTLADEETIRKQYKKLAFQTHPDKNKFIGADGAFKHISDAWSVLSDKNKRTLHDHRRSMVTLGVHQNKSRANVNSTSSSYMPSVNGFCNQNFGPVPPYSAQMPNTFWTSCFSCKLRFQYPRQYFHRYMKCSVCQKMFLASEVPPPPAMDTTPIPNGAMPGTGVASGSSQNDDPRAKAATNGSSSTHPVQQTHGTVSGSSPGSSIPSATVVPRNVGSTKGKEATKRSYQKMVFQSASSGLNCDPTKIKPGSSTGMSERKRRKVSSGESSRPSSRKMFMQLDVERIIVEKMKSQIRDKIEEFNKKRASMENEETMQNSRRRSKKNACKAATDSKEKEMKQSSKSVDKKEDHGRKLACSKDVFKLKKRAQSSSPVGSEDTKSLDWKKPEVRLVYTRRHLKEQEPSSDEMPVPDADFSSFGDHAESFFQKDQVWATYDEEDGMPRYYALIRKVHSTHPFKVRLAFLKADDCNEFGASNWISCGYSKTCGDFKLGAGKYIEQLNTFSHIVTWEKGPGGIIRIFPKKGDIWALYENWSPDWDEHTPDDTMYKYELVEVLDNYRPSEGISVMPIAKISGFVSVFKPLLDPTQTRTIPKAEMLRFSHQVSFHVLTGEESQHSLKGCYELDPGSTPKELLQVNPV